MLKTLPTDKLIDKLGLTYVNDGEKGFSRRKQGKGFAYFDEKGRRLHSPKILERICSLVIPPAWKEVWICKSSRGHLQATGRDQRQRKQYLYHPKWAHARNENKFSHLYAFGKILPLVRKQLEKDLSKKGMPREKVLAAVLQIMEQTHIRVGNGVYAETNDSYGLTTLKNSHVQIKGSTAHFRFKGKSGVLNTSSLEHPRLTKIISRCQDLPGQELFCYIGDDDRCHDIHSQDVNNYLKEITGDQGFTAKDFRTWGGTREALNSLMTLPPPQKHTKKEVSQRQREIIEKTAEALGNTKAVCKKYYIHPEIYKICEDNCWEKYSQKIKRSSHGLRREERILMEILKNASTASIKK